MVKFVINNCYVLAKGEGLSKKVAKQNAAANMWEKLHENFNSTLSDKTIKSTAISENVDINENNVVNLAYTEGSQLPDTINHYLSNEK